MGGVADEPDDSEQQEGNLDVSGIPEFWLTCFKHCESVSELIEEKDEDALRYLENVKWKPNEEGKDSFCLQFFFRPQSLLL